MRKNEISQLAPGTILALRTSSASRRDEAVVVLVSPEPRKITVPTATGWTSSLRSTTAFHVRRIPDESTSGFSTRTIFSVESRIPHGRPTASPRHSWGWSQIGEGEGLVESRYVHRVLAADRSELAKLRAAEEMTRAANARSQARTDKAYETISVDAPIDRVHTMGGGHGREVRPGRSRPLAKDMTMADLQEWMERWGLAPSEVRIEFAVRLDRETIDRINGDEAS